MIGTEPTLGIAASKEVELFVILSPVGTYYSRYNIVFMYFNKILTFKKCKPQPS